MKCKYCGREMNHDDHDQHGTLTYDWYVCYKEDCGGALYTVYSETKEVFTTYRWTKEEY